MKNNILFKVISLALVAMMCLSAVACDKSAQKGDETTAITTETAVDNVLVDNDGNSANGNNESNGNNNAEATDSTGDSSDTDENVESNDTDISETTNGDSAETTDKSDDDDNTSKPRDDEALFAEFLRAYEASMSYGEALTVTTTISQSVQDGVTNYKTKVDGYISFDPLRNIYFENTYVGGEYGTYVYSTDDKFKTFIEDGVLYAYNKQVILNGDDERTTKVYSRDANLTTAETVKERIAEVVNEIVGGLYNAETYADLQAAFAKVYPEILERTIANGKADGNLKYNSVLTVEPEISILENDGDIELTVTSHLFADKIAPDKTTTVNNYVITDTRSITVRDGKIIKVISDYYASADFTKKSETVNKVASTIQEYNLTYGFDQAGYDAIEVSLPRPELIEGENKGEEIKLTLHIGTIEEEISCYETESVSKIFEDYSTKAQHNFGYIAIESTDPGVTGLVTVPVVAINGFYKDAALTQKIDASAMTFAELKALGDVYVDFTVIDERAIVCESSGEIEELPIEYQIVSSSVSSYNTIVRDAEAIYASTPYTIRHAGASTEYRVLVNGIETEGYTITLESGKTYMIERFQIIKDTDKDLDYIISVAF